VRQPRGPSSRSTRAVAKSEQERRPDSVVTRVRRVAAPLESNFMGGLNSHVSLLQGMLFSSTCQKDSADGRLNV